MYREILESERAQPSVAIWNLQALEIRPLAYVSDPKLHSALVRGQEAGVALNAKGASNENETLIFWLIRTITITSTDIKTLRVFSASSPTELFEKKESLANRTFMLNLLEWANLLRLDECSPFLSTSSACVVRASSFHPLCVGVQDRDATSHGWTFENLSVEAKWSYTDEYR